MVQIPAVPGSMEYAFWLCALGGTLFFLLRVMAIIVGGFAAPNLDLNGDGVIDAHELAVAHGAGNSDAAFKLLSLNSISAFILMFGWAGLAAQNEHQLSNAISLGIALAAGCAMMALVSLVFFLAQKLTTNGADFKLEQTVGEKAQVYLAIPAEGKGKVTVALRGIMYELDAEAENQEPIESFAAVEIIGSVGPSLVKVRRIAGASV